MKRLWVPGVILIFLASLGFMTVADDLRHTGELVGVGSLMVLGLVLLMISRSKRSKS